MSTTPGVELYIREDDELRHTRLKDTINHKEHGMVKSQIELVAPGVVKLLASDGHDRKMIAEVLGIDLVAVFDVQCNSEGAAAETGVAKGSLRPGSPHVVVAGLRAAKKANGVLILRNAHHRVVSEMLQQLKRLFSLQVTIEFQRKKDSLRPIILVLDGWTAPWIIAREDEDGFRKLEVGSLAELSPSTQGELDAADLDSINIAEVMDEYPMPRHCYPQPHRTVTHC